MVFAVTYARLLLRAGEVLRLDTQESLRLLCEQGCLWVTVGEEGVDHALRSGETIICRRGRIVVEGPGELSLAPAEGDSSAGGWRQAWGHGRFPIWELALTTARPPGHRFFSGEATHA